MIDGVFLCAFAPLREVIFGVLSVDGGMVFPRRSIRSRFTFVLRNPMPSGIGDPHLLVFALRFVWDR